MLFDPLVQVTNLGTEIVSQAPATISWIFHEFWHVESDEPWHPMPNHSLVDGCGWGPYRPSHAIFQDCPHEVCTRAAVASKSGSAFTTGAWPQMVSKFVGVFWGWILGSCWVKNINGWKFLRGTEHTFQCLLNSYQKMLRMLCEPYSNYCSLLLDEHSHIKHNPQHQSQAFYTIIISTTKPWSNSWSMPWSGIISHIKHE